MEKWVEDIQMAIDLAEKSSGPTPEFLASSPPDNSKCGEKPPLVLRSAHSLPSAISRGGRRGGAALAERASLLLDLISP